MSALAFHFNGSTLGKYRHNLAVLENLLEKNSRRPTALDKTQIFCFDNSLNNLMLIDCLRKLNLDFINLGEKRYFGELQKRYPFKDKKHTWFLNPKWLGKEGEEDNHFWPLAKMMTLYHYIKNNKNIKPYFFLFDQSDVFLTDNPEKKLEVFLEKDCGMLFGAESNCMYWPMRIRGKLWYAYINKFFANYGDVKRFESETYSEDCYASGGHKMVFLNGGMRICNTEYYMNFMDKYYRFIEEFMCLTEQTTLHHFHFSYYPEIQIDNKCEIFQCMYPSGIEYNI